MQEPVHHPTDVAPTALTIAGVDSSGAAGLHADVVTFARFGVRGTSVVTALTAQGTRGIRSAHPVPIAMIDEQCAAVLADLPPAATKTGLLARAEVVSLVCARAQSGALGRLVVDPVLVDGTDRPLVDDDALRAYRRLAGDATVLTPNRRELSLLLDQSIVTVDDVVAADGAIRGLSPFVVVTGGRDEEPDAVDVIVDTTSTTVVARPRRAPAKARGTGCTLAAAITAGLALGRSPDVAYEAAVAVVLDELDAIAAAPVVGRPGLAHLCNMGVATSGR